MFQFSLAAMEEEWGAEEDDIGHSEESIPYPLQTHLHQIVWKERGS